MADNKTDNKTPIMQYNDEGSDPSQSWILTDLGNGVYKICASSCPSRGFEVLDASTDNKTQVRLYDYNGGRHQQFVITDAPDGYYHITDRNSGRVIEIPESKTGNGEWAKLWENNGTDTQHWYLRTPTGVEEIAAPATEGGMAEVYDLTGRMVKTVDASRPDYSGIPAGIYIIRTAGRAVKVAVK